MIRLALLLALVGVASTTAAPVPPPTEKELLAKHWGKFEGRGEYELTGKRLTLRTVGQPVLDHWFGGASTKVPRVTRIVRGDFEATVTVLNAAPPHKDVPHEGIGPATQAGLFVAGDGAGAEFILFQLHNRINGVVAERLQRCVWVNTWSGSGSGGSMLDEAPVGKSTHLRLTRVGKCVSVSFRFDDGTWSEPRQAGRDLELPDEVTVGASFGQSTHQVLSADFHAFTIEKPKDAAKKE